MDSIYVVAKELGAKLVKRKYILAIAESCTGGKASHSITSIPGSSQYFERGFITYTNIAKVEMLGVNPKLLSEHTAISAIIAQEMVKGVLNNSHADVAFSITGLAGPEGGNSDHPIGTVF